MPNGVCTWQLHHLVNTWGSKCHTTH